MIPHSWFEWDPFGGDLYKCMCCLNISSYLIRFKCALGDHQEHLKEHELRGEGQQALWPGRAFWLQQTVVWPGRTCHRWGICSVCRTHCSPRNGKAGKCCECRTSHAANSHLWVWLRPCRDAWRGQTLQPALQRFLIYSQRCWVLNPGLARHIWRLFLYRITLSDVTNFGSTWQFYPKGRQFLAQDNMHSVML